MPVVVEDEMHQATLSVAFTWKRVLCILCSYVTMRILGLSAEDEVCKAAQQWVSGSVVHPTLSRPLLPFLADAYAGSSLQMRQHHMSTRAICQSV